MNAGLGVRIALHTDGLTRTFAGAGVGAGSLTTHRQAAQVANATVALDGLKAFEVQTQLAAQVAFDGILAFLDRVHDLGELLLIEILRTNARIDAGLVEDDGRVGRTNAIDVAKRDVDALLARNFNADDACHSSLA